MEPIVARRLGDAFCWVIGVYIWLFEEWRISLPVAASIDLGLFLGSHFGPLPIWPLFVSLAIWPVGPIVIAVVAVLVIVGLALRFGWDLGDEFDDDDHYYYDDDDHKEAARTKALPEATQ